MQVHAKTENLSNGLSLITICLTTFYI